MALKLIPRSEIVFDRQYFPRQSLNLFLITSYRRAMKMGNKFPPIIVAKQENKYVIVDGVHRFYAQDKQSHLQCEIIEAKTPKEIFMESVKRNAFHGLQFTSSDKARIVFLATEMQIPKTEIASLISIQEAKLEKFVEDRIVYHSSGRPMFIRPLIKKTLSPEKINNMKEEETHISGSFAQKDQINSFLIMLHNHVFNISKPEIREGLKEIHDIIGKELKISYMK